MTIIAIIIVTKVITIIIITKVQKIIIILIILINKMIIKTTKK